ncbi:hypothetical protein FEM03_09430 [Phragmitibacter flavus]|uniref:Uncharacterized protein n=1 Tax=Phragmitibacter flavus TaxID=2576071 RepID=A0A5R8KFN4_9BACT|nr:hypothetical protein [Phragmitibacter flavus]TLD71124.1 hypothetical protein FEM03_09430 [Phragmitibacter flavus]
MRCVASQIHHFTPMHSRMAAMGNFRGGELGSSEVVAGVPHAFGIRWCPYSASKNWGRVWDTPNHSLNPARPYPRCHSLLTSSRQIKLQAPTDYSETPGKIELVGILSDAAESKLSFEYSFSMTQAVTSQSSFNENDQKRVVKTMQYHDYESSGAIRMEVGKTYDFYEAGDKVYRLTISKADK